jgi:16S rRNA (cytosine1402-N4)-methyltransferase
MVREVVELLESVGPGIVVDATVGAGGHAAALLQASPDIEVVGLDADADAVQAARSRLERFGGRVVVRQARFDRIAEVLADLAVAAGTVRGVLFDLGVSSPQLDQPDRGFSYRSDAPLDMRMDRRRSRTAADVVNHWPEDRLAELFAENGEQRLARRIARAVVAARPLHTTGDLATVVAAAVPAPARRRGHPARRVFQAVRIAVNDELTVLADALPAAIDLLAPGGRCVVISYHSGEDRIVKAILRDAATGGCRCPVGLPCVCGARPSLRLLGRSARRPTAAEIAANHRAESARLRAGERLAGDGGVSASDRAGAGDPAGNRAGDGPGRRRPRTGDAP